MKKSTLEIRRTLWRRGNLAWKLRPTQQLVYDFVKSQQTRDVVVAMRRGIGKSYLAILLALEKAIQGHPAIYAGPSAAAVERLAYPLAAEIMKDAPEEIPRLRFSKGTTQFPSGGTLTFIGADNAARGLPAHFVVFDEEGFAVDPDRFIHGVIYPRLIPDNGCLIHISTPPETPEHPYAKRLTRAKAEGKAFIVTLDDDPFLGPEAKKEIEDLMGGRESTEFRREMLCEILTEEKDAVIPRLGDLPVAPEKADEAEYIGLSINPSGLSAAVLVSRDRVVLDSHEHTGTLTELADKLRDWGRGKHLQTLGRVPGKVSDYLLRHVGVSVQEPVGTLHTDVDALASLLRKNRLGFREPGAYQNVRHAIWNKARTDFDPAGKGFPLTKALAAVCSRLAESENTDLDQFRHWVQGNFLHSNLRTLREGTA